MLTNILIWILLGALAGWIASMIMGRNAQMGALANIVVGIVGALIGGFSVPIAVVIRWLSGDGSSELWRRIPVSGHCNLLPLRYG